MKASKKQVRSKVHAIPRLQFEAPEGRRLTSFAGLVVIQKLFAALDLRTRLDRCFRHLSSERIFGFTRVFLQLVLHVLLGYRELRDSRFYDEDPLVKRVLGVNELPDVSTISRTLGELDETAIEKLRAELRRTVRERLQVLAPPRITLDFDGSVHSTGRFAEGTAVGFNKKKKGQRSYYPQYCVVAQTGQVLDVLHRPGNVHDSRGAREFIRACVRLIREALPFTRIEVRADSAFFSDELVTLLEDEGVEFSISVPFERFPQLKQKIENRKRWSRASKDLQWFDLNWKPKSWSRRSRFVCVRQQVKQPIKGPVQLDLFVPRVHGWEFKVIVTNKDVGGRATVRFHEGRGSQENVIGQLKSGCHAAYVPSRRLIPNQAWLLASVLAHNLHRELVMETRPPDRGTTARRAAWWVFERLPTFRQTLLQRAGRFTYPGGRCTLTIAGDTAVRDRLLSHLERLGETSKAA